MAILTEESAAMTKWQSVRFDSGGGKVVDEILRVSVGPWSHVLPLIIDRKTLQSKLQNGFNR